MLFLLYNVYISRRIYEYKKYNPIDFNNNWDFFIGIFSSSETALTSVNIFKIRQMEKNGVEKAPLVRRLVDDIGSVLTTILIGNNIVNIVTTTIATIFFTEVMGKRGAVVSPIILTIVVLIFGEVTPKILPQPIVKI